MWLKELRRESGFATTNSSPAASRQNIALGQQSASEDLRIHFLVFAEKYCKANVSDSILIETNKTLHKIKSITIQVLNQVQFLLQTKSIEET